MLILVQKAQQESVDSWNYDCEMTKIMNCSSKYIFIQIINFMIQRVIQSDSEESFVENEKNNQKSTISLKEWLHSFKPHNNFHLREHVLNFFISEGLFDVAKTFAEQSGLQMPKVDENSVKKRYKLKQYIQKGQIDNAITTLKQIDNDFESSEEGIKLLFSLKCLKVIQMIKANQIQKSIVIARQELLPFSQQNKQYLEHIEKVMSLIAFINLKQSPHYQLTTDEYKNELASSINQKLLTENDPPRTLQQMLILTKWCEKQLQKYVNFPHINFGEDDLFMDEQ